MNIIRRSWLIGWEKEGMWLPCVMLKMWKWKHAELVFHAWLSLVLAIIIIFLLLLLVRPFFQTPTAGYVFLFMCVCVCRVRWGPVETVPETDEADQARYGQLWETERGVVRLHLFSFNLCNMHTLYRDSNSTLKSQCGLVQLLNRKACGVIKQIYAACLKSFFYTVFFLQFYCTMLL